MALTKADKEWIREAVREIIEEALQFDVKQIGGYDGATPFKWDDEEEGRKRRSRQVGF